MIWLLTYREDDGSTTIVMATYSDAYMTRLFREELQRVQHSSPSVPDIDLLIRTSGEQRLSDFLLWESAYAELYFTATLWPDFDAKELRGAIEEYHRRDRRFGQLPQLVQAAS